MFFLLALVTVLLARDVPFLLALVLITIETVCFFRAYPANAHDDLPIALAVQLIGTGLFWLAKVTTRFDGEQTYLWVFSWFGWERTSDAQ